MTEILKSLFIIFVAEMGDKTQILALAFATQFGVKEVLLGVFTGSLLNHGLAVILGAYLSSIVPLETIQIIAGFSFLGFALWTLRSNEVEDEEETSNRFGPILTVATAFFIGELGDKTQLAAITLSVDAINPSFVLMGTVTGMVLTSGVGIFVGSKIGNRIPEFAIKILSASIFMFFGLTKLYAMIPRQYLTSWNMIISLIILGSIVCSMIRSLLITKKTGDNTALQEAAITLYNYAQEIKGSVDDICLGEGNCLKCKGEKCIIGYTKAMLYKSSVDDDYLPKEMINNFSDSINKRFDEDKVINGLAIILRCLENEYIEKENQKVVIHQCRRLMERILFKVEFEYDNKEKYFQLLLHKDKVMAKKVMNNIDNNLSQ
jgi:putative Ca2+/H+ antiporter (TMEM165/GDT1 family)